MLTRDELEKLLHDFVGIIADDIGHCESCNYCADTQTPNSYVCMHGEYEGGDPEDGLCPEWSARYDEEAMTQIEVHDAELRAALEQKDEEIEKLRDEVGKLTTDLAYASDERAYSPITFYEVDGTERIIEWDDGDWSVGIQSGWFADDKYENDIAENDEEIKRLLSENEQLQHDARVLREENDRFEPENRLLWSANERLRDIEAALQEVFDVSVSYDHGYYIYGSATMAKIKSALAGKEQGEYLPISKRPIIVCLCGSTRFFKTFNDAMIRETRKGKIVLSIGDHYKSDGETADLTAEMKAMFDELHFRKIEMADEVLILNVGGYIGESTGKELAYAQKLGKTIYYWE